MNNIKNITHIGIVLLFLGGIITYVAGYNKNNEASAELGKQTGSEQVQALTAQKNPLSLPPKESQVTKWKEMKLTAERLVKESNGNFKKSWALYLVREAKRHNIDPFIVYELLKVETGGTFNPKLVGPQTEYGRAYGMAQFMKNTAPWIADMAGLPYKEELLFDPYYSMQLSMTYLNFLHDQYGNWNEALTAYHRGMGGLKNYKQENGHARSWYAVEIQDKAELHPSFASAK
ncbi:lytic transglycosylase domain-containing protein [Thalassobacillus pellis]|uniref:lytic transglycosylase domain-containing protein n=1 Tax=Thalassobacillus pellis TaxID=748008 RepID=UPI001EF76A2E|nr:transglycosylase SLT domain-containing protein [Thalassobacillus pellis]MBM7554749.1 soluble lytic murein transglycosylase-like protein [Thalassobacillus pellis]